MKVTVAFQAGAKYQGLLCDRATSSLTFLLQEFGLARFKSNVTKSTKGFEYVLARMQGGHQGQAGPDWDGSLGGRGHTGNTPVHGRVVA